MIFAQWSPLRAAFGAFLFGAISRFILDIQGVDTILGVANPFLAGRSATFFLEMLPYLLVIVVVVIGSREAVAQAGRGAGRARDGRTSAASAGSERRRATAACPDQPSDPLRLAQILHHGNVGDAGEPRGPPSRTIGSRTRLPDAGIEPVREVWERQCGAYVHLGRIWRSAVEVAGASVGGR